MATADATAASVRFLVVRSLPLAVIDLEGPEHDAPLLVEGGLFRTLVERGLVVLPRFYGLDLPRGARIGMTLTSTELRLEDDAETRLLKVPRDGVDPAWLAAALRLKGSMVYVGRNLGSDPDDTPKQLCDKLESGARAERVAGAIIGVAESRPGLPLLAWN